MSAAYRLEDNNTTLVYRTTWAKGPDTVGVMRYTPGDMAEVFTADERAALVRGFTVTRTADYHTKTTWVDAVAVALPKLSPTTVFNNQGRAVQVSIPTNEE